MARFDRLFTLRDIPSIIICRSRAARYSKFPASLNAVKGCLRLLMQRRVRIRACFIAIFASDLVRYIQVENRFLILALLAREKIVTIRHSLVE